jgi:hypothetical protein
MREKMTNIIKIETLELTLAKEFLTDAANIAKIQKDIDGLKTIVFDFSTKEGIKQAKELKTNANKFVKELKEFCEPLEADGKKIADARSAISTKLSTGKSNVIDEILAPITERESKLKSIKEKLFIPSLDAVSNAMKIAEIESLKDYKWLGFEEEALPIIEQHKHFILNEKIKFDAGAKAALEAEVKARLERDEAIKEAARIEAEAKANAAAQKEIDDANARAEKAKLDAEKKIEEIKQEISKDLQELPKVSASSFGLVSKERQAKIHNEIVEDLLKYFDKINQEQAKDIVRLFAIGRIRNLKIKY